MTEKRCIQCIYTHVDLHMNSQMSEQDNRQAPEILMPRKDWQRQYHDQLMNWEHQLRLIPDHDRNYSPEACCFPVS